MEEGYVLLFKSYTGKKKRRNGPMWEEAATLEKICQLVSFLLFILGRSVFRSFVGREENKKFWETRAQIISQAKAGR